MMGRRLLVLVAGAAAVACGAGPVAIPAQAASSAQAPRVTGLWGRVMIEVPGLGALSKSRAAQVISVSCRSPGNCAAAGEFRNSSGRQVFVANEQNGQWGRAIEVPGLGALNTDGNASVSEVSCASSGNCAAGGDFHNHGHHRAFVVSERKGRWGEGD